jgi:hypothetical protein
LAAHVVVGDDRGGVEQIVAEGVVAVMMGVDQRPYRSWGDRLDRVEVVDGAPSGGAGVDVDHALAADQERGVVDVPAAIRLDVGEDAVADLDGLARRQRLAVGMPRTHQALAFPSGIGSVAGSMVASMAPSSSASSRTVSPARR